MFTKHLVSTILWCGWLDFSVCLRQNEASHDSSFSHENCLEDRSSAVKMLSIVVIITFDADQCQEGYSLGAVILVVSCYAVITGMIVFHANLALDFQVKRNRRKRSYIPNIYESRVCGWPRPSNVGKSTFWTMLWGKVLSWVMIRLKQPPL